MTIICGTYYEQRILLGGLREDADSGPVGQHDKPRTRVDRVEGERHLSMKIATGRRVQPGVVQAIMYENVPTETAVRATRGTAQWSARYRAFRANLALTVRRDGKNTLLTRLGINGGIQILHGKRLTPSAPRKAGTGLARLRLTRNVP